MSAVLSFMAADHDRLDGLLSAGDVEGFRRGLLRHVGMEEMVLMPAAKKARGRPPVLFSRIRLDHGALTALLIPTPTPAIVAALRTILGPHNALEEREGSGLYDDCAAAVADEAALLASLRALRDIPPAAHADGPHVTASVRRALDAAGYQNVRFE